MSENSISSAKISRVRRLFRRLRFKLAKALNARTFRSPYGVRLRSNWADVTFRYYAMGSYGTYLSGFLASVDREFAFLDIGANQGLYSLIAAKNPQCRRVVAFEPVAPVYALMCENIALNGCDQVIALQQAVSDTAGELQVEVNPSHSGATSIATSNPAGGQLTETIVCVDHEALDRLGIEPGLRVIVKVDVEGHEETVIRELAKADLFEQISDIYFEADEAWMDVAEVRAFLDARGFDTSRKVGSSQSHYDIHAARRPGVDG